MNSDNHAGPVAALTSVLLSVAGFFFSLTVAFAVPILCRPFYYVQIGLLNLVEKTGYSYDTIREAFDEVMDFLTAGKPFGTGSLAWSESGKSHFEDCRFLFQLDFVVLAASSVVIILLLLLVHFRKLPMRRFGGRHPFFYTGIFNLCCIAVLGIWGAVSFDSLFVAFHSTFFPGKTNWIFDTKTDQIINILPEQFFMNCGILVLAIILVLSVLAIILGRRKDRKTKRLP